MTTITRTPTSPARTTTPHLDLEARLALTEAAMGARLDMAGVAFEVNTAHIPAAPLTEITGPLPLTPTSQPCPYRTPLAALLHRARIRLDRDGWCRGTRRNERGSLCLDGAVRAEARHQREADNALVLLLEAIRRDFPTAETVPAWNDSQLAPLLPGAYLDRAATLAHSRLL
ncbi:hypothetical protein ACFVT5_41135 [Streptomyces sp. NPDC058001]|uniref:DUF6197 family protein n=1 Tax=Streptomyces sp. NPDC058001 TaxID=3346300 RepID=UPI0036E58108